MPVSRCPSRVSAPQSHSGLSHLRRGCAGPCHCGEGAGDTGCAQGWAGSPWGTGATSGTLGDVAPCHCHPAPSWKELPAGTQQDSGTLLPRGPQGPLPSSPHQPHPGAAGVPLPPTLPPAQLRQFRAANMWLAGLLGAIRAVGGGRSRRGVAEQMSRPSTGDAVQH